MSWNGGIVIDYKVKFKGQTETCGLNLTFLEFKITHKPDHKCRKWRHLNPHIIRDRKALRLNRYCMNSPFLCSGFHKSWVCNDT